MSLTCSECPSQCPKNFSNLEKYEIHLANDHFELNVYECSCCTFAKFPTESTLIEHYNLIHRKEHFSIVYTLNPERIRKRNKIQEILNRSIFQIKKEMFEARDAYQRQATNSNSGAIHELIELSDDEVAVSIREPVVCQSKKAKAVSTLPHYPRKKAQRKELATKLNAQQQPHLTIVSPPLAQISIPEKEQQQQSQPVHQPCLMSSSNQLVVQEQHYTTAADSTWTPDTTTSPNQLQLYYTAINPPPEDDPATPNTQQTYYASTSSNADEYQQVIVVDSYEQQQDEQQQHIIGSVTQPPTTQLHFHPQESINGHNQLPPLFNTPPSQPLHKLPIKPRAAYQFFQRHYRKELQRYAQENGHSFTEAAKSAWDNYEDKSVWFNMQAQDKQRYELELQALNLRRR
uniref:HMG box domain-containing protein n=1 Tax=Ditylenchus dipsaci TaxID=166011 RepID=A0A915ELJ9_9BILA